MSSAGVVGLLCPHANFPSTPLLYAPINQKDYQKNQTLA